MGILGGVLKKYSSWKLPSVDGRIEIPSKKFPKLSSNVTIIRDKQGVPHIYGETPYDVFFGQGFVTAQERLVALDVRRRVALGQLSEALGEVTLLADRLSQTLGFARVGKTDLESMSEKTRHYLEAFIDGVNFYLESSDYHYPLEVVFGYPKPRKFTLVDITAIARMICWQMNMCYVGKLVAVAVQQALGEKVFDSTFDCSKLAKINLEALERAVKNAPLQSQGSNSFIISGGLTESGNVLFENDCHLPISSPSTWLQVHVKCKEFEFAGHCLVGTVGIQSGFNSAGLAFGSTLSMAEAYEIFLQNINPENEDQYKYDGAWEDFEIFEEQIQIKGKSKPYVERVRVTKRNGVMFSNVIDFQEDESKPKIQYSIKGTCCEPFSLDSFGLILMATAKTLDEFVTIASNCKPLSASMTVTDSKNIAIVISGGIPKRTKKAEEKLGAPLPGWDSEYSWQGYQDEVPIIKNPECGFVIACNHDVMTFHGVKSPFLIGNSWIDPARALRIRDLILEKTKNGRKISIKDVEDITNDITEHETCTAAVKEYVKYLKDDEEVIKGASEIVKLAVETMMDFDGKYDVGSVPASLFEVFRDQLTLFSLKKFGVGSTSLINLLSGGGLSPQFLNLGEYHNFIEVIRKKTFENQFKTQKEKAEAIHEVLKNVVKRLKELIPDAKKGKDPKATLQMFQWGKIHHLTFEHAIGEKIKSFNRGPYPVGGNWSTPNLTGQFVDNMTYKVLYFPTMKNIVDMGDLNKQAYSGIWPGNSCHIGSPWFDDGIALYLENRLNKTLIDDGDVKNNSKGTLRLELSQKTSNTEV